MLNQKENIFGQFVKEKRKGIGLTLRNFCKLTNLDASNWSKIERGKKPPPQKEEKLFSIAEALKIERNTPEWQDLLDKAHIASGIIPPDLLTDEEVVDAMPVFFRTIRGEKPTEEDIDLLIKKIRKGDW